MEYIQKFFATIVDFVVFVLTGRTLSFAKTFDEILTFTSSFSEIENLFAWADAFLPIELIRILIIASITLEVLRCAIRITTWVIDIITL